MCQHCLVWPLTYCIAQQLDVSKRASCLRSSWTAMLVLVTVVLVLVLVLMLVLRFHWCAS